MIDLLFALRQRTGTTLLLITHDERPRRPLRPAGPPVGWARDPGRARRMKLALTLARRELRGGVRGLWIVVLCLALGVGVIASVGTLARRCRCRSGRRWPRLLGGDLEIDGGSQPLPDHTSGLAARARRSHLGHRADAFDARRTVRRAAIDRTEGR